jgi:predicted GNAT superfamily acetyltransferase
VSGPDDVHVRELDGAEELRRCVALQKRIWGERFAELVPPAILWVAQRTGGIVAGAFDGSGRMFGFVFGMSGFVDGRAVHWSDMLAVEPDARGRGTGTLLKRYQRDTLLRRGIEHVAWTFDPLESRNAWINFAHLGVTAREYVRDCYGQSDSPLHAGFGTDRLIASWALASDRVRQRMDDAAEPQADDAWAAAPVVNGDVLQLGLDAPAVRIRIPADVQQLKRADPHAVRVWRDSTRAAFEAYFAGGYEAVELLREGGGVSSYVLVRRAGG